MKCGQPILTSRVYIRPVLDQRPNDKLVLEGRRNDKRCLAKKVSCIDICTVIEEIRHTATNPTFCRDMEWRSIPAGAGVDVSSSVDQV